MLPVKLRKSYLLSIPIFVEPVCISFTFGGLESHLKKLGEAHGKIREDSVGKGLIGAPQALVQAFVLFLDHLCPQD